MPTFPDEVYDEMLLRCEQVSVFTRLAEGREDAASPSALGAIVRCSDDGFLAVELGQTSDDLAFVTVRRFDAAGEPMEVGIVELDGSVLIQG